MRPYPRTLFQRFEICQARCPDHHACHVIMPTRINGFTTPSALLPLSCAEPGQRGQHGRIITSSSSSIGPPRPKGSAGQPRPTWSTSLSCLHGQHGFVTMLNEGSRCWAVHCSTARMPYFPTFTFANPIMTSLLASTSK